MAFLDFLTEGKPIPAGTAPVSISQQTVLPDWYTNYAMQMLADQGAVSARAYPTFPGPRVAGFTPDQLAAQAAARTAATSGTGTLGEAGQATRGLLGSSSLSAAQPYFGQATALSPAGAESVLQGALSQVQGASQPSGMTAAQPYLTAASLSAPDLMEKYMSPYMGSVVDRIAALGGRNLRENILPGITDQMTAAGQFGGSRQAEMFGRGVRDISESVLAEQNRALQAGYGQAQEAAQADLSRQAQLASTAGQLGQGYQQALLEGAGRTTEIGRSLGGLTQEQQRLLTSVGSNVGTLAGADLTRQGTTAGALSGLASQERTMALGGAGALSQIGQEQQALGQRNLDLAYADFLRQQGYPQEQINAALGTLKGIESAVPQDIQKTGIEPLNFPQQYAPSTASQIGSGLATGAGILDLLFKGSNNTSGTGVLSDIGKWFGSTP